MNMSLCNTGLKNQNFTKSNFVVVKIQYRDLLTVLPMREPSIFRGIAVSLLRPVIGSNVEIDVVALNWVADVRKQMIVQILHFKFNSIY